MIHTTRTSTKERGAWALRRLRRTSKMLGLTAVVALAAAGISYAAIPDGGGVIHGCYGNTAGGLRVIDSAAGKTCPTGTTALNFNQQGPAGARGATGARGPQGPAGVSAGISNITTTKVTLQSNVLSPMLFSRSASVSGYYYVNATAMFWVAQGENVVCTLTNNDSPIGVWSDVGPVAISSWQTVPATGRVYLYAGQAVGLGCYDSNGAPSTYLYNGAINATLIASEVGPANTAQKANRTPPPSIPPR
jgi:hypothetical protein